MSSSCFVTRLTSPALYASAAFIIRPPRISSIDLDLPTARVIRWVAPAPGIVPKVISGCPNFAFSEAMIISHIIASSHPPPRAYPLTAAIVGILHSAMASHALMWSLMNAWWKLRSFISLISAPAAKALPAPVKTMTLMLGFDSRHLRPLRTSWIRLSDSALSALGLFKVIIPTLPIVFTIACRSVGKFPETSSESWRPRCPHILPIRA
mmetsp:Transcript_23977/g.33581  ORF Transcript_23977/g.33581 Transcript_23977/m.33581 type:complete len:209 (-) Transcript_23977:106-732(-)